MEGVGTGQLRVQPNGAALALAELGAVGLGDQGGGQGVDLPALHLVDQVDAREQVAPLVVAPVLEGDPMTAVQLEVVDALQHLVAELGDRRSTRLTSSHVAIAYA